MVQIDFRYTPLESAAPHVLVTQECGFSQTLLRTKQRYSGSKIGSSPQAVRWHRDEAKDRFEHVPVLYPFGCVSCAFLGELRGQKNQMTAQEALGEDCLTIRCIDVLLIPNSCEIAARLFPAACSLRTMFLSHASRGRPPIRPCARARSSPAMGSDKRIVSCFASVARWLTIRRRSQWS